jgi:hypothetical protein
VWWWVKGENKVPSLGETATLNNAVWVKRLLLLWCKNLVSWDWESVDRYAIELSYMALVSSCNHRFLHYSLLELL